MHRKHGGQRSRIKNSRRCHVSYPQNKLPANGPEANQAFEMSIRDGPFTKDLLLLYGGEYSWGEKKNLRSVGLEARRKRV